MQNLRILNRRFYCVESQPLNLKMPKKFEGELRENKDLNCNWHLRKKNLNLFLLRIASHIKIGENQVETRIISEWRWSQNVALNIVACDLPSADSNTWVKKGQTHSKLIWIWRSFSKNKNIKRTIRFFVPQSRGHFRDKHKRKHIKCRNCNVNRCCSLAHSL